MPLAVLRGETKKYLKSGSLIEQAFASALLIVFDNTKDKADQHGRMQTGLRGVEAFVR